VETDQLALCNTYS